MFDACVHGDRSVEEIGGVPCGVGIWKMLLIRVLKIFTSQLQKLLPLGSVRLIGSLRTYAHLCGIRAPQWKQHGQGTTRRSNPRKRQIVQTERDHWKRLRDVPVYYGVTRIFHSTFLRGNKGALRIPSLPFNTLEGQGPNKKKT